MENKKMSISIVIPNYNGEDIILQCLKTIYMQVGVIYEIIVVDDNSNDNSIDILYSQMIEKKVKIFLNGITGTSGHKNIIYSIS